MARVEIGSASWQNLETLLGSSLTTDTKYQIQNVKDNTVMVKEGASEPTAEEDGFILNYGEVLELKKESGVNVYVKSFNAGTVIDIEEEA